MLKRKSLHVTIPEDLIELIEAEIKPGQSKSQIVEGIIRKHFEEENGSELIQRIDNIESAINEIVEYLESNEPTNFKKELKLRAKRRKAKTGGGELKIDR